MEVSQEGTVNSGILHAVVLGPADRCNAVRDVILQRGRCRLSVVTSYCELFSIPKRESFQIAIIHELLSLREFRDCASHVRRTWPRTKILVICAKAEVLDDPLYDECVTRDTDIPLPVPFRVPRRGHKCRRRSERVRPPERSQWHRG